jgi:hypothetical protein
MRRVITAAALALLLTAGCSSNDREEAAPAGDPTPASVVQTTAPGTTTATAVIEDLRGHGFKVTSVKETDPALSGAKETYDTRLDGVEAGVLVFASVEATQGWAETSDAFGGIAVVGDSWAISLDSDGDRARSRALARKIAAAIGGTVR